MSYAEMQIWSGGVKRRGAKMCSVSAVVSGGVATFCVRTQWNNSAFNNLGRLEYGNV
jgi:hypothetical protein